MKELEDYNWFPGFLRRFQTEFIGAMVQWTHIYQPIAALLDQAVGSKQVIVDLCTGSANPIFDIAHFLPTPRQFILTDKFPNPPQIPAVSPHEITFETASYDVLEAPFEKKYFYTMFNAFHHFTESEQVEIMESLSESRASFLFVEILQPNTLEFVKILATTTIGQILATPFIAPFSLSRLFFTYIFPINLITVTIDGVISVTKSKSSQHYQEVGSRVQTRDYQVTVKTIKTHFFTTLTVIQGHPTDV